MKGKNDAPHSRLTAALEAINNLAARELNELLNSGQMDAMTAHAEIGISPVNRKSQPFYRQLAPFWNGLISVLAKSYRQYFRLALAHPAQTDDDPGRWAWEQVRPAARVAVEWLRDWYVLACDGENENVRHVGRVEYAPGQTSSVSIPTTAPPFPPVKSWCAPAWLFAIAPVVGIGPLKEKHVPAIHSDEKLGAAHTRLLLAGRRRVFLDQLRSSIEIVRNEEIAAAGAIPAQTVKVHMRGPNKRKGYEQRLKLYGAIQKALRANPSLEGIELCAELDKRHAPSLLDWVQSGEWREGLTWKEAWGNPVLHRRIRRVRQEAMKAARGLPTFTRVS